MKNYEIDFNAAYGAESILAVRHQQSTSQHYTAEKSFFMEVGIITDAGLGWAGLGWAGLGWAGLGWAGLGWLGWLGWGELIGAGSIYPLYTLYRTLQ